ncbi:translation initiation factor IF-2 [Butyrivibrio sp. WCE2006]|uniref:translation initiation factor IF-2 n=1 Tax=Butyrivibrio sp. WCE2006 TaxID=1410611 RepID=UPI0009DF64BA|nr:translation initiation factor IF-2 [Butyrivibrio sp. WCE2006]
MSKIKISELASELGVENKELVAFLQEQGVEAAKRSTSSIEDDDAEKVRKHFGSGKADTKTVKNTGASTKEEISKDEKGKSVAMSDDKKGEKKPMKKKPEGEGAVKKKKNIIFVTNPNNSKSGNFQGGNKDNNRGGQNKNQNQNRDNNNRGGQKQGTFARSQNVYHPIKPLTAPSQLESYNTEIPKYQEPSQKRKPEPAAKAEPVKKTETPANVNTGAPAAKPEVQHKEERPAEKHDRVNDNRSENRNDNRNENRNDNRSENRNDNRNENRGDNRRNDNREQGGQLRKGSQNDRARAGQGNVRQGMGGSKPGQGAQGRPNMDRPSGKGKDFSRGKDKPGFDAAPINEGKSEGKRRSGQDKDKKSKKDHIYEENEEMMPRSKRVGRFIKPEVKKVEEPEEQIKVITIPDKLTIKELADKMKLQPSAIIKKLFMAGQIVTVNSELSYEEAENIAIEYDIICEKEVQVDVIEELLKEEEEDESLLTPRPPVVCVMGHVDHGKTSLLDAIRDTSVTDKEAGGITQRIGAYQIKVNDRKITFLDTPGHEAFTAMRMRGANSTDIAVLVVAADDGVMPQTIEAINHAKAAGVEIIVAVNKIDKPSANVDRVKQEMTEYGLIATDWGGTTEFVPVSAKTGEGMDVLLDTILITADILELKANANREARGLVLEAKLDKGRGPVANVLVQKGTLHVGDFISAGACSGKVRAMIDDKGKRLKEARPSQPVEILGLSDVPGAGEVFLGHQSDKEAKQYANTYLQQQKKDLIEETKAKMSLDELYSKIEEGKLKELDLIIKADVQGSVEALKSSLLKLSNDEVVVKVIHGGVGAITESDVSLAAASNAIIIGFDVRPDAVAKSTAEHEGVEIKLYKVIYQAIEDVEYAMKGMLAPVYEEKVIGHAEIRQLFKASKVGNIAGAIVTDGMIQKDCKVRISRGDEQIFEGDLASLKRFKDDVKEVKDGYECGLVFEGFDSIQVGDTVEAYIMVEIPREKLDNKK